MTKVGAATLAGGLFALAATPSFAQVSRTPTVAVTEVAEAPVIDGRLDDAVWAEATPITDFRQVIPIEGGPPSERTEVRLLRTPDALYVGFHCFDREPDAIVVTQMERDGSLGADDNISFVVDPFFDRRNGFFFQMNAAGARVDGLVENNDRLREDWDGIWNGRAAVVEDGWTAEFEIPVKTLSFDTQATRWGFNAARFVRRRNETIRWASPTPNKSFISMVDAGVVENIAGFTQGVGLDIVPYGLTHLVIDHENEQDDLDFDAGFDAFYNITPSLRLALTFNTDFADTEVDERRINLTRFPLFFPEKRDFFLQDEGIFSFGGINRNPLPFQSRRIGLDQNGTPIDIVGGIKLTGRVEGWNVGLLDVQMEDDETPADKNLFVGRVSKNILQGSSVGAIVTNGDPQAGNNGWIGGVDLLLREEIFGGTRVLSGSAFILHGESDTQRGGAFGFKLGYPNDRIDWQVGYTQIDDDYDAPLGFVPRRGIREYFGNYRYRWRPEHPSIRRIDASVRGFLVTDLHDAVESQTVSVQPFGLEFESGDFFFADVEANREVLGSPFEIADGVVLPAGDYRFNRYEVGFSTSQARPFNVGVNYAGGEFYSGTRDDYSIDLAWRASEHLFLAYEFGLNDVKLDEGDFITRIMRGRVNIYFTPDLVWTTLAQYDSFSDSVGINSRVRWIVEPGQDVYFVVSQSIDRDGSSYRVTRSELTTKVGWTFRF